MNVERHCIVIALKQRVFLIIFILRHRADLKRIYLRRTATDVQPCAVQIPAQISELAFRVNDNNFDAIHVHGHQKVLDRCGFAHAEFTSKDCVAAGTVMFPHEQVQRHDAAIHCPGEVTAVVIPVQADDHGETAHQSLQRENAFYHIFHQRLWRIIRGNMLIGILLQITHRLETNPFF